MTLWYGYVGSWVFAGSERKWVRNPEADGVDRSKPAVGQWFYWSGDKGQAEQSLYVKVYATKAEAVVEYNSRKREGAAVVMWSPEEQRWEPPQAAQGLTKPCACAARR